jgi:hypothetical protein
VPEDRPAGVTAARAALSPVGHVLRDEPRFVEQGVPRAVARRDAVRRNLPLPRDDGRRRTTARRLALDAVADVVELLRARAVRIDDRLELTDVGQRGGSMSVTGSSRYSSYALKT